MIIAERARPVMVAPVRISDVIAQNQSQNGMILRDFLVVHPVKAPPSFGLILMSARIRWKSGVEVITALSTMVQ